MFQKESHDSGASPLGSRVDWAPTVRPLPSIGPRASIDKCLGALHTVVEMWSEVQHVVLQVRCGSWNEANDPGSFPPFGVPPHFTENGVAAVLVLVRLVQIWKTSIRDWVR